MRVIYANACIMQTIMRKKYKISFATNTLVIKADDELEAIDRALEYQIYNNLPTEIISVKSSTYISKEVFSNY
jgi:hypothetical protein